MRAEKIVAVKKLGIMKTMDIEVKNKNHCFYGNGIATSNSHAMCYAINGYWSAYIKAHFPVQFFTAFLIGAKDAKDPLLEAQQLVNEAKLFDIEVYAPDITKMRDYFWTDGKNINFGFDSIKGLGCSQLLKLKEAIKNVEDNYKPISRLKWYEFLLLISDKVNSTTMHNLIACGALDNVN